MFTKTSRYPIKTLSFALLLSCTVLTACENSWLGENEKPPLEGERVPLFKDDAKLRTQGAAEAIDVTADVRDDVPMRDVTPAEAAAIASTEAALREMEQDLKADPLAEAKKEKARTAKPEDVKTQTAEAMSEDDAATAALMAEMAAKRGKVEAAAEQAEAVVSEGAADTGEAAAAEATAPLREAVANAADAAVIAGFIKPPVWENEFWPQVGGYANHAMQNLAFTSGTPKKIWSTSIGAGSSKQLPLTALPIVVDEKVFTLDAESDIRAFDVQSGKEIWTRSIIKESEKEPVIGGGLAFSGGQLYATNGFNEVLALDPFDGSVTWRTGLNGPARAAPSAVPGKVFVTTLDNRLVALNADDGKIQWDHQGLTASAGLLGSASPAANREIIVPAYSSGEIYALRMENGSAVWADNLTPARRADAEGGLTDIRALPVLDKGMVIAISYADKMVAIDERTGQRVWEQPIGGAQTPWVAGNRIFVVDKAMNLYALDRANGAVVWKSELPAFKKPKDRKGPIDWFGPVFAGDRVMVFSSEGEVRNFDPATGAKQDGWKVGTDIVGPPAIAGGKMYLLSSGGVLSVWQ